MTGDIDTLMTVVAALAIFLGGAFGWPWLVRIGQRIRGEEADPKNGTPQPIPEPIPVSALRADAQQVAGPGLLSILLPFLTTLIPLILDLIAKFRERNGREPTRKEVNEIIRKAQTAAQEGRVHAVMFDDLPEQDLERVTAGASKVTGLVDRTNRTLDSIDQAAREGRDLFRRGNDLLSR